MFPTFVATLLGLPAGKGQLETFDGAGSVNQSAWYFTDIELKIGLIPPYRTRVGFTPALNLPSFGLLGQQGFFEQFKTEFNLANDMFYIDDSRPTAVNPPASLPATHS